MWNTCLKNCSRNTFSFSLLTDLKIITNNNFIKPFFWKFPSFKYNSNIRTASKNKSKHRAANENLFWERVERERVHIHMAWIHISTFLLNDCVFRRKKFSKQKKSHHSFYACFRTRKEEHLLQRHIKYTYLLFFSDPRRWESFLQD